MSKIPCEVIKDLMPLYIEDLTSEVTGNEIEEHIAECEECKKTFESMKPTKEDEAISNMPEVTDDKLEIDFLKKNKRYNRIIAIASIAAAFIMIIAIIFARVYLIGNKGAYNDKLQYRLDVVGNKIIIDARMTDGRLGISDIRFSENDNIITIDVYTVSQSVFHRGSVHKEFETTQEPLQIIINDSVVWYDGETIDKYVSDIYKTGHLYVGDMPANMRTAEAVGVYSYLGPFNSELKTDKEPFEWIINVENDVERKQYDYVHEKMDYIGCVLIGMIDNLDRVTFNFTCGGKEYSYTVTQWDADDLAGAFVKRSRTKIRVLNNLVKKLKV